jgi:hypothetical protein
MALHMNPTATRTPNGTESLDVPGIVGITQGNQVTAAPKSNELQNIKIPVTREKVKDFDFSLWLIFSSFSHFLEYMTSLKTMS